MSMNVNGLSGSVQLKTVPGQGPIVENIGVEPMTFPPVAGRPGPYMTKTLFQYVMNLYFRRNKMVENIGVEPMTFPPVAGRSGP